MHRAVPNKLDVRSRGAVQPIGDDGRPFRVVLEADDLGGPRGEPGGRRSSSQFGDDPVVLDDGIEVPDCGRS